MSSRWKPKLVMIVPVLADGQAVAELLAATAFERARMRAGRAGSRSRAGSGDRRGRAGRCACRTGTARAFRHFGGQAWTRWRRCRRRWKRRIGDGDRRPWLRLLRFVGGRGRRLVEHADAAVLLGPVDARRWLSEILRRAPCRQHSAALGHRLSVGRIPTSPQSSVRSSGDGDVPSGRRCGTRSLVAAGRSRI